MAKFAREKDYFTVKVGSNFHAIILNYIFSMTDETSSSNCFATRSAVS